jgi:hypothetical protein
MLCWMGVSGGNEEFVWRLDQLQTDRVFFHTSHPPVAEDLRGRGFAELEVQKGFW